MVEKLALKRWKKSVLEQYKEFKKEKAQKRVIKTLGFSRACIYNWLARYRAGGWHALKTGNRTGRSKKLGGKQIA